ATCTKFPALINGGSVKIGAVAPLKLPAPSVPLLRFGLLSITTVLPGNSDGLLKLYRTSVLASVVSLPAGGEKSLVYLATLEMRNVSNQPTIPDMRVPSRKIAPRNEGELTFPTEPDAEWHVTRFPSKYSRSC